MRAFILIPLISLSSLLVNAQGILNNGAHIVLGSPTTNIYIDGVAGNYKSQAGGTIDPLSLNTNVTLLGNWINNGGNVGFLADGSNVIFAGAAQTIGGTSYTHFYNVRLLGSGTKTLLIQTRVGGFGAIPNGSLNVGTRPLDLNGFDLWITNPAVGGINYTTGYIQSETNVALNPSQVRWVVGTNTGSYVIPFGLSATQIPLTINVTAGMSLAASYFIASTRATLVTNNTPWASTVTQMYDPTLAADGSVQAVIDRWWEFTFSHAATSSITFSYRGAENTLNAPYNTGNIGAQYWAAGWIPDNSNIGSAPAVLAGVGAITAPGIPFVAATYKPMVLSSLSAPLPVELLNFDSNCSNGQEIISWSTATEMNNDYFAIERSDDGNSYHEIGRVNGSGTTSQVHTYSFSDPNPSSSIVYYRLRQTDYNGQSTTSTVIAGQSCGTEVNYIDAFASGGEINLLVNVGQQTDYAVAVLDARGRVIIDQNISANEGANQYLLNGKVPATGIYLVRLTSSNGKQFVKRLFISVE
jgi:hypothetical protein